jgi:hypothetical protein
MFTNNNLLSREMIQINNFERKLYSFDNYSFDAYSTLKLINVRLKNYVNNGLISADKQVLLDFNFELEQEIEALADIRYSTDKDEEFMTHVNYTLGFIRRFKVYFPQVEFVDANRNASAWLKFKDYLKMHLLQKEEHKSPVFNKN